MISNTISTPRIEEIINLGEVPREAPIEGELSTSSPNNIYTNIPTNSISPRLMAGEARDTLNLPNIENREILLDI